MGRWATASIGEDNGCGITLDGQLWCWGLGGLIGTGDPSATGSPLRVGDETGWTAVSVGPTHACGLRSGELWCWGSNQRGALGTGQGDVFVPVPIRVGGARWSSVDVADAATCGIQDDASLWCWGANDAGQLGIGGGGDASQPVAIGGAWHAVSIDAATACGIASDGSLRCWGSNDRGQLGDGSETARSSPVAIATGRRFRAVATGGSHTCAIDDAGLGWCWGANDNGQLGTGSGDSSTMPARIAGPAIASLGLGARHTCATTGAGELWCWGAAIRGSIPGITALTVPAPIRLDAAVANADLDIAIAAVAIGADATCVVDSAAHLACTGANSRGQSGAPAGEVHALEVADARRDWREVYAHRTHACGETNDGMLHCWGLGDHGQLGDATKLDRQTPIEAGRGFTKLAISGIATAALRGDELWGWGLDVGGAGEFAEPVRAGTQVQGIGLGDAHGCSLATDGTLLCGGVNDRGQLGDGTLVDAPRTTVPGVWRSVAASIDVSCATRSDAGITDRLFCWGAAELVGSAASSDVLMPQPVALPTGEVAQVALGTGFGCAIVRGGEAWCWGADDRGQLGGPAAGTSSPTPVRVGNRSDWTRIAAGDAHACAIAADRSLWCWGSSDHGQLGLVAEQQPPVQLGAGMRWLAVAAGDAFTCAIAEDGTRWCLGGNAEGELGNGRSWRTALAIVP